MHGRFHKTGPHKEFAMYSDISLPKVVKSMCFASIMFIYLGNFAVFPAKISFWLLCQGYFAKFHLFPHKIHIFYVKCTSILYYVCVLSKYCIKLNFMPFACLLSNLFILWHFHFKMSNSMLYAMFGILVQH